MADSETCIPQALAAYIATRTAGDDEFLTALKRAARDRGLPEIWISPAQASFIAILLRLCKAREVVEVGTLAGYAAIRMARALPLTGRVRTLEVEPAHAAFAREWVAKSDVSSRVQVLEGAAAQILPTMATGSVDAIFLDADKPSYPTYLEEAMRLLPPGGLFMADNAFAFGQVLDAAPTDPEAPAMAAFNEVLAADPRLEGAIVPLGDGLWVGVKN